MPTEISPLNGNKIIFFTLRIKVKRNGVRIEVRRLPDIKTIAFRFILDRNRGYSSTKPICYTIKDSIDPASIQPVRSM